MIAPTLKLLSGPALVFVALAGCTPIGSTESQCGEDPSSCISAREAYNASNGAGPPIGGTSAGPIPLGPLAGQPGATPPSTDTVALQNGEVMRIWTAPYRDERGALHVSGYTFVEMEGRQWKVGLSDFYWTAK